MRVKKDFEIFGIWMSVFAGIASCVVAVLLHCIIGIIIIESLLIYINNIGNGNRKAFENSILLSLYTRYIISVAI